MFTARLYFNLKSWQITIYMWYNKKYKLIVSKDVKTLKKFIDYLWKYNDRFYDKIVSYLSSIFFANILILFLTFLHKIPTIISGYYFSSVSMWLYEWIRICNCPSRYLNSLKTFLVRHFSPQLAKKVPGDMKKRGTNETSRGLAEAWNECTELMHLYEV